MKRFIIFFSIFFLFIQNILTLDIDKAFETYKENGKYLYGNVNIESATYSEDYVGFEEFLEKIQYNLSSSEKKTIIGIELVLNGMGDKKLRDLLLKAQNVVFGDSFSSLSDKNKVLIYAIFNKSVEILEKRVFVNMIAEIDSENVPKTEFPIDLVNDKSFKIKILLNEKMNSSFIIEKNSGKYDVGFYYGETKMKNYDYKAEYSETISAQLGNDWKYTKLEGGFMILTYSYFQFPNIKEGLISYQYAIPTTINESNITGYFDFSDELSTYNSGYYAENYKVELLK